MIGEQRFTDDAVVKHVGVAGVYAAVSIEIGK